MFGGLPKIFIKGLDGEVSCYCSVHEIGGVICGKIVEENSPMLALTGRFWGFGIFRISVPGRRKNKSDDGRCKGWFSSIFAL